MQPASRVFSKYGLPGFFNSGNGSINHLFFIDSRVFGLFDSKLGHGGTISLGFAISSCSNIIVVTHSLKVFVASASKEIVPTGLDLLENRQIVCERANKGEREENKISWIRDWAKGIHMLSQLADFSPSSEDSNRVLANPNTQMAVTNKRPIHRATIGRGVTHRVCKVNELGSMLF